MSFAVPLPEAEPAPQAWGKIEVERLSDYRIELHEGMKPLLWQLDCAEDVAEPLVLPLPGLRVTRRIEPDDLRVYSLLTSDDRQPQRRNHTGLARCILVREIDGPVYAEKHGFRQTRFSSVDSNVALPFGKQDQEIVQIAFKRALRHYSL